MTTTALVLAAAGCGRAPAPVVDGGGGQEVARCSEVPEVVPPDEHLRDEPIYVGNEQPVEELSAWASGREGFEQLWIDRDHLGWVVLAFSRDAEAVQAELARDFPDAGAVVVPVDWTMTELTALQDRVAEELGGAVASSIAVSVTKGVVSIGVGPMTEDRLDAVAERFAGERVCVEGVDPETLPSDGPQAEAGDGWRLLADERAGQPYRTWIAADEDGYVQLWESVGLSDEAPAVDFGTEVVIWFGAVYSGSCPDLRFEGVEVDHDRALVYADITYLDEAEGGPCTADANPRAYVVAVDRDVLPPGRFAIQLGAADPPPGAPEERTVVDADLTQPGAGVSRDQLGPDPALAHPQPAVIEPGGTVEAGFPFLYRLYLHCGPEWLGPVNDVMWRSEVTEVPPAWLTVMDRTSEELVAEALVETDPTTLTVTANDHDVVYHPTSEEPPGCD